MRRNITGTRKSESSVLDVRPPTTASARGWFASVPASRASAVGTSPTIVARLVMAMGTKRDRAAWMTASTFSTPSLNRLFASSTSRMPFDTLMPMTMSTPMRAAMESPWPAASSASTTPTSATGMVNSMISGNRSDLNCDAMMA